MIFSFNYKKNLTWKIGIFGGVCTTAIVYFLLLKGAKDLTFMTPEVKAWIDANTSLILGSCLVVSTIVMQILHALKINVLKVVVLIGTFALAMAFAGNDLVNFIGVPLTGLSSYQDFIANGGGDAHGFMMSSLNESANTPIYFLVGAGIIMVFSLTTSKKAMKVSQTTIGLGSQSGGDEMFGSSRIARRLVRWTLSLFSWVRDVMPLGMRRWFSRRFNVDETIMEQGAAFDLIRGAVSLVLAGALIALGTSWKLPLSTTFVTFMVAMGTSLADRAWGRESAVFRITGVISVIGGWFLTAGVAFLGAGIVVAIMHYGGLWSMYALAALTVFILVHSNRKFKDKNSEEQGDTLFQTILATKDPKQVETMFLMYISGQQSKFLTYAEESYRTITTAFVNDNVSALSKAEGSLVHQKRELKNARRKETLCLRQLSPQASIEKSAWFYLSNNCCMSILYNLRRINEVCKEHVENNFLPLPQTYVSDFENIREQVSSLFKESLAMMESQDLNSVADIRKHCDNIKDILSETYHKLHDQLREGDTSTMTVLYVYLNLLQETQEMISSIRKYLRAFAKIVDNDYSSRHPRQLSVEKLW